MQVVWDNLGALNRAFYNQDAYVPEISREILDKLCRRCTACSPLANIDREIERLKEFEAAGLTDIALRVYGDAKEAIRIIGEHVLPEFDKPAQAA